MKNILSIISLFLLLSSCSKNKTAVNSHCSNASLIGKWEWVKSSGGFLGQVMTPSSTNKTIFLEITPDRFKIIENGVPVSNDTYTIQSKQSMFGGVQKDMIVFGQDAGINKSFIVNETQLLLSDECYDCYISQYIRK